MANEGEPMAELAFDLEYEGPALANHEMNVRDLAPALLATAEFFQEMNRSLRPTDPPVSVNVRATGEGSFWVELKLFYEAAVVTLSSPDTTAAGNLASLVSFIGPLLWYRKNRAVSEVVEEEQIEPGMVRIKFANDAEMEIPAEILDLDRNPSIRHEISEVVRPLSRDGVDRVQFRREEIIIGEVLKPELPAFLSSDPGEAESVELGVSERSAYLEIISPVFQRDNKWRFSDGRSTFWAKILDTNFLDRVDSRREAFVKSDTLHVRLREMQKRDEGGRLFSEIEVLEVLEHVHPPHQPALFSDNKDDDES